MFRQLTFKALRRWLDLLREILPASRLLPAISDILNETEFRRNDGGRCNAGYAPFWPQG
jgi:hypothetical protein